LLTCDIDGIVGLCIAKNNSVEIVATKNTTKVDSILFSKLLTNKALALV
jgi:hypothetical protein